MLYKFPLFSMVRLKLGHSISKFILRLKIGIFECWSLCFQIPPNSIKSWEIGIFEFPLSCFVRLRIVFNAWHKCRRGGGEQWLNCQF